jgi:hypothetical protein
LEESSMSKVLVGNITGPPGAKGDTGNQGGTGAKGDTGDTGPAGPSGVLTGFLAPKVVALTDQATLAIDASLGNDFRVTLGADRSVGAPTNPSDGQPLTVEVASASHLLTWSSAAGGWSFDPDDAPTLSTDGSVDIISFRYNTVKGKWVYLGSKLGT